MRILVAAGLLLALSSIRATAQFIDEFDGPGLYGWSTFTGDGEARVAMKAGAGFASIIVDATGDRDNVWWALIKHEVSASLDLARLSEPEFELRVEARLRVSHAPRRVNLHLNTQMTVDFHTHLMEYDIPDTLDWYVISMTTSGFDAAPGDVVNAQLALMDWGLGIFRVDLDYFRVDVVDRAAIGPDLGEPLPYHPPIPPLTEFSERLDVLHDVTLDLHRPELNLNQWRSVDPAGDAVVLAVGGSLVSILRWDLSAYSGREVAGAGLLELRTRSIQRSEMDVVEYGQVRVTEVLGGDPQWDEETVTYESLSSGLPPEDVFNTQMIIDVAATEELGGATYATITRPVLQRLVDGKTLGLALRPLGPIQAAFYAREEAEGALSARLYFNVARREAGGAASE